MKNLILVFGILLLGLSAYGQRGYDFEYWDQDTITNSASVTFTVTDDWTRAGYNWFGVKVTKASGTAAGSVTYFGRVDASAAWQLVETDTLSDVTTQYLEYWAARPVKEFKAVVTGTDTGVLYVDAQCAFKRDE